MASLPTFHGWYETANGFSRFTPLMAVEHANIWSSSLVGPVDEPSVLSQRSVVGSQHCSLSSSAPPPLSLPNLHGLSDEAESKGLENRLAHLSLYIMPRQPRAKDARPLAMEKRVAGWRKAIYCKGYFVAEGGWRMRDIQYRK